MDILTNEERTELGLTVDYTFVPCGCPECVGRVKPGHFACELSPNWALELEVAGNIVRHYDNGAWRWFERA